MTPAFYVIAGFIFTLLGVGLCLFAGYAYLLANAIKEAAIAMSDLAFNLQGLPSNLHGMSPALAKLAEGVTLHERQVEGLVAVIADANKGLPPDRPEKFDANGADANWNASMPPPSPFDEEERR